MASTCFYWQHPKHGPLIGVGQAQAIQFQTQTDIEAFGQFIADNKGKYIFGTLAFDLKNYFEKLDSKNQDQVQFPELHFWIPESIYCLDSELSHFWGQENANNKAFAAHFSTQMQQQQIGLHATFKPRTSKDVYFQHFNKLKNALQRGDIYEVNYCQELFVENYDLTNPYGVFGRLTTRTKAPHAAFIQTNNHFIFCASPERFIQKTGNQLRSEPIKGTAARNANPVQDAQNAKQLQNNPKERAENIMIVDLVRNDLSRIALKNSVQVEELCQIYSFETVHQMISKISCELASEINFIDILRSLFPMGSMTGAPKIAALERIEAHEDFKRGLYSGSIGLIEPNGDFDFNVVIRSLLYNRQNRYLSVAVGSALTIGANPEDEYNECLLKADKLIHGLD